MKLTYSTILFCFFCSCNSDDPEVSPGGIEEEYIMNVTLEEPFDTNAVLSQMKIIEFHSKMDSINEQREGLKVGIDTLELTYYFGFCDCQSWVISEIHDQTKNEYPELDELDPRGQIQFNLDEHGFYLEPALEELEIDWRTGVNGTHIRVIGREYEEKGLAGVFTVPDPPKGRVFRYYSYEIIRPYSVWGPDCVHDTSSTGEKLSAATILLVE